MFSYLKINYIDILIKYVTSRRLSEKMTFRNHIYIPLIFIFCFLLSTPLSSGQNTTDVINPIKLDAAVHSEKLI